MLNYPMADGNTAALNKHLREVDEMDARVARLIECVDVDENDYDKALEDFDAADLITVAFNNPHKLGSPQWVQDMIRQCEIDQRWINERAEEHRNERVESEPWRFDD